MAKRQFTTKYRNFQSDNFDTELNDYNCPEEEETLASGLCIFHDENYLRDDNNRKEHEQKVNKKLMVKVSNILDQKEALLGIGYHLPDNITMKGDFIKLVFFSKANLQRIDFSSAKFSGGANFVAAEFSGRADFGSAEFSEVHFASAKFSDKVDFMHAKFSERADFGSAEFSEVHFASAKFSGEANFGEPLISEPNFRHQFNLG